VTIGYHTLEVDRDHEAIPLCLKRPIQSPKEMTVLLLNRFNQHLSPENVVAVIDPAQTRHWALQPSWLESLQAVSLVGLQSREIMPTTSLCDFRGHKDALNSSQEMMLKSTQTQRVMIQSSPKILAILVSLRVKFQRFLLRNPPRETAILQAAPFSESQTHTLLIETLKPMQHLLYQYLTPTFPLYIIPLRDSTGALGVEECSQQTHISGVGATHFAVVCKAPKLSWSFVTILRLMHGDGRAVLHT